MYKRLRRNAQNFIDTELKYSTDPKSKTFFVTFCRIFIKMECLKHYDAKYAKTNLSLHIKIIFFSVFAL